MNRRTFLTRTIPSATIPFLLGGFRLQAYGRTPLLDALLASMSVDRVLVLIQLSGGNDGLNMIIPLDQYSQLSAARSNIMIAQNSVLKLSDITGIHPAMTGLQTLYNNGHLSVIQGVSYPNPNFSHFRATDIWLTGSDYNQVLTTGWFGRYLDQEFPGYPTGYPSVGSPDPLGIQIGSIVSPGLDGPTTSMGLAITDPNSTYTLPGGSDTAPSTPSGYELTFVRTVAQQAQSYTSTIKAAATKGSNKSTLYPTKGQNSLADQLRIVAQLISGGLKTRIYVVNLGGFDTHSAQVDSTDATHATGTHAKLLGQLSLAISAFMDDIALLGVSDKVIGMTFSEFGRRIKSNASSGTDHGTAEPMFVFGKNVQGGLVGTNPVLPVAATVNDNLAMQFDFRQVYATVLQDWFGASNTELSTVLSKSYTKLPLVASGAILSSPESGQVPREFVLEQNYPNPFNPTTRIAYVVPQGVGSGSRVVGSEKAAGSGKVASSLVRLAIYDTLGREVKELVNGAQEPGRHEIVFDASALSSGTYLCRMEAEGADGSRFVQSIKMILLR
jgi:uncharacterized protein (DUF1501 family)